MGGGVAETHKSISFSQRICIMIHLNMTFFVFVCRKVVQLRDRVSSRSNTTVPSNVVVIKEQEQQVPARNLMSQGLQFLFCTTSPLVASRKLMPPGALSSMDSAADPGRISNEDMCSLPMALSHGTEFNRVNCLVWVLHESARSFSLAVQTHELARTGPELAMAWIGVDVHAWHKNIAYKVPQHSVMMSFLELGVPKSF